MSDDERKAIITVMFEGIIATHNSTAHQCNSEFEDCHTFAHAALASLEANGFKVIRST